MSPADDDGPDAAPARRSRRWFLAGGAAAVVGGGAGVGIGFAQPTSRPRPEPAPAALVDAVAAERGLLALAAAAVRRDPSVRAAAAALVSDHTGHLRALQSALAPFDASRAAAAPVPALGSSPVQAQLRAAERSAAAAAAVRAAGSTGAVATLLASISACEATHVELLTP